MKAVKIKEDVYLVGVQDPDLKIFDIIMTTELGTTYNAYLIKGQDKTALVETVKASFFNEYLEDLQEVVRLQDINYLIMNHTEPDHAGSVEQLIKMIPGLTILGSPTALNNLKEITNRKFSSREVHQDDELNLGGKTLKFINVPFLHWPDSMYSYLKEEKILFSCDSFGSHYAEKRIFHDLIEKDITLAVKDYFDDIMGPFKPYVLEAMDKIEGLPIEIICPGHGPIIRNDIQRWIDMYREWAAPDPADEDTRPKIVLAYVTAYGYTEMIADQVIEGLSMVEDFNVKKYNLIETSLEEVMADIANADGLLIGSPTLNGDTLPPVWNLLTSLSPIKHAHLVASAFGAYGWSGEAVPNIESRLRSLRMQVLPGLRINFKPSARNLDDVFIYGMDFGKAILEKHQDKSQKKWRCLVCGQVFEGEEPPDVCPACGVGWENFVSVKMEDEFVNDTAEKFLIIGGGIAALSAASSIRKRNQTAGITILSEETIKPYYRPALPGILGQELPEEKFSVYPETWYEEQQIELKTGCRVLRLDISAKTVEVENGASLTYDHLIIATGARSNIPSLNGAEQQGVFSLRNFADAQNIKAALDNAKQVVVIGGEALGLELVEKILAKGLAVSVVEARPRVMSRQLDEAASLRLQEIMRNKGVKLYLGMSGEELLGNGKVSGVRLNDGQVIDADLVLLTTGAKPNVELALEAGIKVNRGIVVDAEMRTSAPNVFAVGDVAEFDDCFTGMWPIALEMGRVAGANATGDWLEYDEPVLSTLLSAFDLEIFSVGEVNISPDQCRVVEVWDPVENFYKKSYIKEGVLVGEIIIAPQVNTVETLNNLGRDSSGQKRANKWKCRKCGYIHEGPEPPDECPVCGARKDMFDPVF